MKPSDCDTLADALRAEFHRLNHVHFDGQLTEPQIVVSRRKTFGGYYQPRLHKIVVSAQAFREYGMPETLNTFRHEVAHIVHPNHSPAFWKLAIVLGATQRHASPPKSPVRQPRFAYACPGCGRQILRHRRFRKPTSCGVCDKSFNPAYLLCLAVQVCNQSKAG